jgi:ParB/RepB/Spo0J family partition protein
MAPKTNDKMRELRERASAMMNRPAAAPPTPAPAPEETAPFPTEDPSAAAPGLNAHFGIAALDQVAEGRSIQQLPLTVIAPDMRPEFRQPRLLPPLSELFDQGRPNLVYADLVASLLDLGRSLQERQIQPIIVYPGTAEGLPEVRYLILVGHRRWTAAYLVGMTELDAVVVDPPDPVDRVRVQYAENEDRADFSDMERVWALQQMKHALGDAPWEQVEERFQMSRGRRQELLRLATFTSEQQVVIARLRLRETQLRPLHAAARVGDLQPAQIDAVLGQLGRLMSSSATEDGETRPALDGPTIARVVARAKRTMGLAQQQPTPKWALALRDQLDRVDKQVTRTRARFGELSEADAAQLRTQLESTARRLQDAVQLLDRDQREQE